MDKANIEGNTPLHIACKTGSIWFHSRIAPFLDIKSVNIKGNNLLYVAFDVQVAKLGSSPK